MRRTVVGGGGSGGGEDGGAGAVHLDEEAGEGPRERRKHRMMRQFVHGPFWSYPVVVAAVVLAFGGLFAWMRWAKVLDRAVIPRLDERAQNAVLVAEDRWSEWSAWAATRELSYTGATCSVGPYRLSELVEPARGGAEPTVEDLEWADMEEYREGSLVPRGGRARSYEQAKVQWGRMWEESEAAWGVPARRRRALVVGCGIGRLALALAAEEATESVVCVDPSFERLEVALQAANELGAAGAASKIAYVAAGRALLHRVRGPGREEDAAGRGFDLVVADPYALTRTPPLATLQLLAQMCDLLAPGSGAVAVASIVTRGLRGDAGGAPVAVASRKEFLPPQDAELECSRSFEIRTEVVFPVPLAQARKAIEARNCKLLKTAVFPKHRDAVGTSVETLFFAKQ